MILSFHPCFEGDRNIICAGRLPDRNDLDAIRSAKAVILSQGCRKELYEMARDHCCHLFPDYTARFRYPGKIEQIKLFQITDTLHPRSVVFSGLEAYLRRHQRRENLPTGFSFPLVFKYDWGGEGSTVFKLESTPALVDILQNTKDLERAGRHGFLLQAYVPSGNRVLRVVVIGQTFFSYWRVQSNTYTFIVSAGERAHIDHSADPDLQEQGIRSAQELCQKTGVNLAGFDYLFPVEGDNRQPHLLEINYFFGRRGLGGSEPYYDLLVAAIKSWIDGLTVE